MGNTKWSKSHVKLNYMILALSVQLKSSPLLPPALKKKPVDFKAAKKIIIIKKVFKKGTGYHALLSASLLMTVPFIHIIIHQLLVH